MNPIIKVALIIAGLILVVGIALEATKPEPWQPSHRDQDIHQEERRMCESIGGKLTDDGTCWFS